MLLVIGLGSWGRLFDGQFVFCGSFGGGGGKLLDSGFEVVEIEEVEAAVEMPEAALTCIAV